MHILHLAENLNFGGLETHIITLCHEFKKLGHRPFVFAMVMSREFQEQLKHLKIDYMVEISCSGLPEYITKNNIQVLHGHPAATIHISAELGNKLDLPVAVTYHGLYGWGWHSHDKIAKIICVSREVYDKLAPVPGFSSKLEVIQNGIDLDTFSPSGVLGTGRQVLFIGRLDPDKYYSLNIIINALRSIPGIKLSVAGSGPYFDRLKSEAPPWVTCLGYVQNMPLIINQADIVIGTGRGIREAMACGKPAIALDACGYDGLVTPDKIEALEYQNFSGRSGGILNEENLLGDLRKLVENPDTRAEIGQWSRKYAAENYALTPIAIKHLAIYSQLINKEEYKYGKR